MAKKALSLFVLLGGLVLVLSTGCVRKEMTLERLNRDMKISNPNRGSIAMPFDLINNLVVIPMRVNDSDTLYFILDTGARQTIITELEAEDRLTISYDGETDLVGLGISDPVPALLSSNNEVYLRGIKGKNHDIVVLLEGVFNLSGFMGRKVNGLLGYDIFENFIVEIDYQKERLFFRDPDLFKEKYESLKKSKAWKKIPLEITGKKPYLQSTIYNQDGSSYEAKLLIDSGASHTFFLYPDEDIESQIPPKTIYSFLGTGLNGEIYGKIGRIKKVRLNEFSFDKPVVFFPEIHGVENALSVGGRDGSVGSELLKRFTVIFNYSDSTMLLKPNKWYKEGFNYNMSGIEINTPFANLPYYVVSNIREGSPADLAGIEEEDVLYALDSKKVYDLSLNDIQSRFQSKDGDKIKITIYRDGRYKTFHLKLKDETI